MASQLRYSQQLSMCQPGRQTVSLSGQSRECGAHRVHTDTIRMDFKPSWTRSVPRQGVAVCNPTILVMYPNVLDTEVTRLLEMGVIYEMGQVQVSMLIHTLQCLNLRIS